MKKVFLIPNAITAFSLTCGLFVIFKASLAQPQQDMFTFLRSSAILLVIAAIADAADGAIARLMRAESEFGGQFDSLSDAVTFGVAPPLLILKSLTGADLGRPITFLTIIAAMIYSLCGVLRLVRYNLKSKATHAIENTEEQNQQKKHFTGLPIPAAAAACVSAALMLVTLENQGWHGIGLEQKAFILVIVMVVIGYFMISRWKFPSIKALHFRVPSFYLVFSTGIIAVFMLYGILDYFPEAFFIVSWLYLVVSWSLSFIRLLAGRRSKTLEDFEPDQEE